MKTTTAGESQAFTAAEISLRVTFLFPPLANLSIPAAVLLAGSLQPASQPTREDKEKARGEIEQGQ